MSEPLGQTEANLVLPGAAAAGLDGLIWGYRFNENGQADALDGAHVVAALERRESWIWLHFDLLDNRARAALELLPHLPEDARALLLGTDNRQRLETHEDVLAGVVTDFERSDDLDPRRMAAWRFCMAPHLFVSARRTPLHTMANLNDQVLRGRRFPGVLQLFDGIVHGFAGALSAISQRMSEQLDEVEDGLLDDRDPGDFEMLGTVRRRIVRLHRQALPLRTMLHQLIDHRPAWFSDEAAEDCTEVAHRVDSIAADLVALQERAHALQDELASRQAELTNRRLMLISVVSAVLLPPTLITGVFGMNVDGLPFKDNSPFGFVLTVGLMVVSVVGLLYALRRMKMF